MDAIESWKDFNVAMTGATAALAGLVIVAGSVNIGDIVRTPSLTSRLGAGISGLVLAILVSAAGLVPGLTPFGYGLTAVILALAASPFCVDCARKVYQNRHPENRAKGLKVLLAAAPVAVYLAGGAMLIAGAAVGLTAFAVGAMISVVSGLLVSWVVLVEVLR